ncbi:phage major capsid protein [Ktedonospora formicarum]|uniref:Phage major capsid protein n=1 Tax=Ktedonospora formicarum TaxID=2778364 RepID=A0A8J3I1W1_9CHLR|nr:phage major capsid protein [Ktedonospora formicarum]GHO45188.1 hypothetical protein KSX_33510 [Ktedonospora formicarum]
MTLSTDELIRKASGQTSTTQLQALIPQIWASVIEKNLRRRAVFQQSIVENTDLLAPDAGDQVYIPILPDLAALGSLTEGTDIVLTQLNGATSIPLKPSEVGMAVEVTRKALDRLKYDGVAEVMDRLSYAMSLNMEGAFANLFNATVPGTSTKISTIYANNKATGTITTTDTFSDQLILNGVAALEQANNVPFDDGYYRLYISPTQYTALMMDQNTRQDLRYAAPERLLTGEKGALHGCRVIVTNFVQNTAEGSGGAVPVQNAMLLAPRWAAVAWKRRPQPIIDPTLYDMGRRRRFGILADYDAQLIHAERAMVLKSA